MYRIDTIKTLLRVVETGSFSVAARELGVGQPAVSKAIARLESELGVQLVGRTTRRVSTTRVGQRFVDEVGPLVRALDDRIAQVARGDRAPSGTVRLAVAPGFGRSCVLPAVRTLRAEHPGLTLELAVSDVHADLVAEHVDLAVRGGELVDSSLVARRIGETPLLLVASTGYLARHGEPRSLAALRDHDAVLFFAGGVRRPWRFGRPRSTSREPERVAFLSSNADDIRGALAADIGLAQVPGWLVARDLANGTLRPVLREHEPNPIPIHFVRTARARVPERVRVVERFLLRAFAREPLLQGGF